MEAAELNLPLPEYILRLLSTRQILNNPPKTGVELVAYWQREGIINSRPDIIDVLKNIKLLGSEITLLAALDSRESSVTHQIKL